MQVSLTGRHMELTAQVRQYVEEKAEKLPRYYDRIHSVEVVLERESDVVRVEMLVHADHGNRFVASETGSDPAALIDIVAEKMERQLRKHKERYRNRKHGHRMAEPSGLQ